MRSSSLGPLAVALFDPTPIPACADCPENAFLISDAPGAARGAVAYALFAAAIAGVVFMRLVRRYRAATPPLRRVVGPVYLFTLEALAALVASSLVRRSASRRRSWLEHLALARSR